ncbi:PTS sugar transporter subunit IIA [Clostridium tarantellae]|uniref:PTS sugar transporter subunit IIA n=1 Tax=Clostridium tarantellae TaxID=39493 RepID=A0A6I1MPH5_9CLOT|nr:PTS sugar transporter subunit IIA [Clostridium tarantellae]MPQ44368.1 PTS sugar transporter subunit IIA [Clostridium tarantellae]
MDKNIRQELFEPDLIFIEDIKYKDEVFEKISKKLLKKGVVKETYIQALKKRENEFPTGINLSVVAENIPNIAIPHTESGFCNDTKVVLVKLKNKITFKDMMNPSKDLDVKYLFMILNKEGSEQSHILSYIMSFVTNKENMYKLEKAKTLKELYNIVKY